MDNLPGGWDPAEYPEFTRWQESMMARRSVKHVLSVMANEEVKREGKATETKNEGKT